MSLTRRQCLQQGVGAALLVSSPSLFAQKFVTQPELELFDGWFSAQGSVPESYGYGADLLLNRSGQKQVKRAVGLSGFRGHGAAQHPVLSQRVLMFGRRPSTESIEVDLNTGEVTKRFSAQPNRHFFGHGAFSEDGKTLFTVEADLKRNVGVIGIRDAETYQWLGEYDSYGVGPHQMMLMPDGKQLVVANGGILTRPESGRKKLNLETMRSSLAYIDIASGQLNSKWLVPESKASIRHLDVAPDGTVALAMQVQREACQHEKLVALTAVHKPDREIQLFEHPEVVVEQMADYVGSVAIHPHSRIAGFTSPRGDVVGFWNIDSGEFSGYHAMRDVCGIAASKHKSSFVVTNSYGMVHSLDATSIEEHVEQRKHYPSMAWDNHMIALS